MATDTDYFATMTLELRDPDDDRKPPIRVSVDSVITPTSDGHVTRKEVFDAMLDAIIAKMLAVWPDCGASIDTVAVVHWSCHMNDLPIRL